MGNDIIGGLKAFFQFGKAGRVMGKDVFLRKTEEPAKSPHAAQLAEQVLLAAQRAIGSRKRGFGAVELILHVTGAADHGHADKNHKTKNKRRKTAYTKRRGTGHEDKGTGYKNGRAIMVNFFQKSNNFNRLLQYSKVSPQVL
jgi:hypothetical protein